MEVKKREADERKTFKNFLGGIFVGKKGSERGVLPKPIAMIFILNATSLQLLPTTVISMRSQFGSVAPADIILPTALCTAVTTLLGILLGCLFFKENKNSA